MRALGIDIGGSSVKLALIDSSSVTTSRSGGYESPSRDELVRSVHDALELLGESVDDATPVGLCVPGKQADSGHCVARSLNLPCLEGWAFDEMLQAMLEQRPACCRVVSDIEATAADLVCHRGLRGRIVVIAIGTGVGMAMLEDGRFLSIGSRGIGNLGQLDVGRCGDEDVYAKHGARNTLECYIGVRALVERYGASDEPALAKRLGRLMTDDPPLRAVVRALRTVHAIYTPDTIVLAGGVGIALSPLRDELRRLVCDGLTTLVNPDWQLCFGESLFHAASGAARLASG